MFPLTSPTGDTVAHPTGKDRREKRDPAVQETRKKLEKGFEEEKQNIKSLPSWLNE